MLPWTDRSGHLAPLKCAAFISVLMPALWLLIEAVAGLLGSRPVTEAIHQSGLWAIRLLAISLAITPLIRASRYRKLLAARRIFGVSVFAYAALHLSLYIADQHFRLAFVLSEIFSRLYLTIGFGAFCGLCVLASTSFDRMIARLGSARWTRLQQTIYVITILAVIHFFMQSKADVSEPIVMGGIFALLGAHRVATKFSGDLLIWQTAAMALILTAATALSEASYYHYAAHAPFGLVLASNLDFSFTIRPAWFVLSAGLALLLARAFRFAFGHSQKTPSTPQAEKPRHKAAALGLQADGS